MYRTNRKLRWFVILKILFLAFYCQAKPKKLTIRQIQEIYCDLYGKTDERYFLIRSFSTQKIGISCKNRIFVYSCLRSQEAWFAVVTPGQETRESESGDEGGGSYKEWNKMWVVPAQKGSVSGGGLEAVSLKFTCELYCDM